MSDEPTQANAQTPALPHAELLENMLAKLEAYFSSLIAGVLTRADTQLLQEFNAARNIAERNRLQEFMHALRKQRAALEKRYFIDLNQYFKPVAVCKELPRKKREPDKFDGLSLVSQDEMDELVALTSISSKAADAFREEMAHLELRLEYLATINPNVFHARALDPHNLCDAFRETMTYTDFAPADRLMLLRFYGDELLKNGKSFFRELNEMLIAAGVMPRIDYHAKIVRNESRGPGLQQVAEHYTSDQVRGPLGRGGQSGGYYAAGGGNVGPGSRGTSAPGAAMAGGMSAADAARISAGVPVGQIRQGIINFLGGDPSSAEAWGGGGAGGAGGVYYSRQDVVSALSSLQSAVELMHEMPLRFDADAIKKAVLTTIGEKEGGAVTKRVNQISEKTVDFIKLIFDAIIEDKSITDTIKALLLSLQIPIIKAAMLDADFFIDDQHAARQLLDKIAEAGVGVSDHKDPVYIEIRTIVKKLLQDYSEDITAFNEALEAIKALTERIYNEAREREKKSQQEVKHAHARNVVLQEIRKITLGRELPHNIRLLVLKVWPSLMFNHYLRFGKANDEWVEMLMILSKVIESVQSHHVASFEELGLSHEDIIRSVSDKLKKCRKPADVINQTMADLRAAYEALPKKAPVPEAAAVETAATEQVVSKPAVDLSIVTSEPAAVPVPAEAEAKPEVEAAATATESEVAASTVETVTTAEAEHAEETEEEYEEQITPEEVARLKLAMLSSDVQPGAWFIVYNGEGRPVRRLKLAVILMQDATLVFVDHLGNVVIEKDAEEFSKELERGLSSVIMQHSVFDHALRSALKTIER